MTSRRHEFTAEETADLLDELDTRLRRRGVAASIFVVGGAAIAANQYAVTGLPRTSTRSPATPRSWRKRRRWPGSAVCPRTG